MVLKPILLYFKGWLNLMLVFFPILIGLKFGHSNATFIFVSACLSIIPLAGILGSATEELGERAGAGIGGLLNATFGNAAELIISIAALRRGLSDIVKASLTGSIIGNLLFVMGLSILAGGMRHKQQVFNRTAAATGVSMLSVGVIGMLIPAAYHHLVGNHVPSPELPSLEKISLWISGILILNYICGLVFSLKTHSEHYHGEKDQSQGPHARFAATGSAPATEAAPAISTKVPLWVPISVLLVSTVCLAYASEALVGAIEPVMHRLAWTDLFVGAVVIAIIGNAAEHSTAVMMATRNKMDLSMQICIGSSLQIALFVAPVLVFVSRAIAPHPMTLEFSAFEIIAVMASVFVVHGVIADGESNWYEGVQLLSLYAILAASFYFV